MTGRDDDGNGDGNGAGLNFNDPDPTAGASDVGGRAGDDDAEPDGHETGGGHTGLGKGPTGS